MRNLNRLVFAVIVHVLIVESVKISPKLDFGDESELVAVRKDIKYGKIKGLRVTVDTSELKGAPVQILCNRI